MNSVLVSNSPPLNPVCQSQSDPQMGQLPALKLKSWRVIHACEFARDVLSVVEGQVAAGMRPYIVTPQGAGAAELYLGRKDLEQADTLFLLRAWQDVRNWRKSLLDCEPETTADLVHTHSFASGMAGVRNLSCVVYDLNACIEELALSAGQCERGSWMGRSFRVAEQFILSRAKAVVVHSRSMKLAVEERGALSDNVFVIPDPLPTDSLEPEHLARDFLQQRFGIDTHILTYFAPQLVEQEGKNLSSAILLVLEAFALARNDVNPSRLLIAAMPANLSAIQAHAQRLGIAEHVLCIDPSKGPVAFSAADIVIATGESPLDQVQARQPNHVCLQAMIHSRALLAADVPGNREISPDGRGCLWFKDGDPRDLAYRMAFLGGDAQFRSTLAASGRAHIIETRNSAAVGRQYDAAYRHALKQKRSGGPGQTVPNLMPLKSAV